MLTNHDANVDPRYEYVDFERGQPQQAPQYQRIEYRPQRAMGFVEDGPATGQSSHAGNFDMTALVGQGMDLLQSGGKDDKGNPIGKLWNK